MAHHLPDLSENRRDRLLVLVYLIVVPLMILTIVLIGALQTRTARNEAKDTAADAQKVAQAACKATNKRDKLVKEVIQFSETLVREAPLTAEQQKELERIDRLVRALRPQDCTP